jgi:metal-dependent amidase/aminoacylase/carboxypeptidase family protein
MTSTELSGRSSVAAAYRATCTLHNPSCDFNDALIPVGGTMWVRLAEAFLNG